MKNSEVLYKEAILDIIMLIELRKANHHKFIKSHSFSDITKHACMVYLEALTEISSKLQDFIELQVNQVEQ